MIEVYLKHRPNNSGYTDYWKDIFSDTNRYVVYELTEENRPNCVHAHPILKTRFGGVFASHVTSFLATKTEYHWAIDSEDIKFEDKITKDQIRELFIKIENDTIANEYDGFSYDMYLSILGGEEKIGPKPGVKFKDMIKHWTFGMAFLKKQPEIVKLIFERRYENDYNMDWKMSELRETGVLKLKTFIVKNATVHHTWGDIKVAENDLDHNGVVFPIQEEVIKYSF